MGRLARAWPGDLPSNKPWGTQAARLLRSAAHCQANLLIFLLPMKRFFLAALLGSLAGTLPLVAAAQAAVARVQAAVGDGLRGDYYQGINF